MANKLYIVMEKTTKFNKDDIVWYGTDLNKAQQQCRYWMKNRFSRRRDMIIKEIDLDTIPDYQSNAIDDQTMLLDRYVSKNLTCGIKTRCLRKGTGVTYSIGFDCEPEKDDRMSATHSGVTARNNDAYLRAAELQVFNILLDNLMKDVEILVPVTLKVNGKTYKEYKPKTKE